MIDISEIQNRAVRGAGPRPGNSSILSREINLFGSGLNDRRKERFYSELHTLLTAGVDIRTAFELLAAEAEKKEDKLLYAGILGQIVAGATLPDAIHSTGKFTPYEFYSLRIGEESGRMNIILQDLATFYSKKIKQKRKVTSALSYPIIVLLVALLAVVFMLRFVVPMFADMLTRFGAELPALTKAIISASDALGKSGPWILLFIAVTTFILWTRRKTDTYRRISSWMILRIPFIGKITLKVYVGRFAHSMQLLLTSKTNLIDALELVQKMVGFYPIEQSLDSVRKDILAGVTLHESLGKFNIYPKRMISLIRVAEEVNQVDAMFAKLSQQLSDEIDHETSLLGSIIEPVMILFLGVMVAIILVAMYLPMFKLGSAF